MTVIELFVPAGALTPSRRDQLGERLVTELMAAPGAPAELIDRARAITHLVIHEPSVWTVGGRPVNGDQPRYIVRVSVPGGHLDPSMRAEMVTRITRVLADGDDEPDRFYEDADAWVHINELADGNVGAFGQIMSTAEITDLVVHGTRPTRLVTSDDHERATVIDPICGMTVALTETAITFEHEGQIHAFCSPVCREIFTTRIGSDR